jgi:hypothetical protein
MNDAVGSSLFMHPTHPTPSAAISRGACGCISACYSRAKLQWHAKWTLSDSHPKKIIHRKFVDLFFLLEKNLGSIIQSSSWKVYNYSVGQDLLRLKNLNQCWPTYLYIVAHLTDGCGRAGAVWRAESAQMCYLFDGMTWDARAFSSEKGKGGVRGQ